MQIAEPRLVDQPQYDLLLGWDWPASLCRAYVEAMKGECKGNFIDLVMILSNKYCTLCKSLKGKDAYLNNRHL